MRIITLCRIIFYNNINKTKFIIFNLIEYSVLHSLMLKNVKR